MPCVMAWKLPTLAPTPPSVVFLVARKVLKPDWGRRDYVLGSSQNCSDHPQQGSGFPAEIRSVEGTDSQEGLRIVLQAYQTGNGEGGLASGRAGDTFEPSRRHRG